MNSFFLFFVCVYYHSPKHLKKGEKSLYFMFFLPFLFMIVFCMLMKIKTKHNLPIFGVNDYLCFLSFRFKMAATGLTREQSFKAFDGYQYVYNHER